MAGYIRVRITSELIESVLRTGGTIAGIRCIDGLPEDAVLDGVSMSPRFPQEVCMRFRSNTVEPEGATEDRHPAFQKWSPE